MTELCYQELNLVQILDVLRPGGIARLGLSQDGQPYVVPMAFQLEARGTQLILHLASPDKGRKMEILRQNDRVCLEVERQACAWIDIVIIEGYAAIGLKEHGGVLLSVHPRTMSGRRFFLAP